jgi:hypothetical protein
LLDWTLGLRLTFRAGAELDYESSSHYQSGKVISHYINEINQQILVARYTYHQGQTRDSGTQQSSQEKRTLEPNDERGQ